jgi:hypothetical protein
MVEVAPQFEVLRRLIRIVFAYLVASVVTGYVVNLAMVLAASQPSGMNIYTPTLGLFIAFFVFWYAAAPAAITVALGEYFRLRMWWFYSIAGSLIGVTLGTLFKEAEFFPMLGLTFGVVSGLIYWFIVGRHAGLDLPEKRRIVTLVVVLLAVLAFLLSYPSLFGAF